MISTSLPLICAALLSASGDRLGVEALQAAAWNRPDARSRLETFLASSPNDDPNYLAAAVTLREVAMGQSDYRQADAWNRRASELAGRSLPHLSDELHNAPPQVALTQDDDVPLNWGLLGLPRVDARFGTTRVSALVDTGAEYAVITESLAKRAGLNPLPDVVSVGGSAGRAVGAKITLADITLGQSHFLNAVVIIVADDALSLPMGFKIDAIIGMPQLRSFAALEFNQRSLRTLTLAPPSNTLEPNIAFDGWRLVTTIQAGDMQAWMQIDTGARRSILYEQANATDPTSRVTTGHGLGGGRRFRGSTERANLRLADHSVTINELQRRVLDTPSEGCIAPGPHSLLGQDVLRQGAYRINFTAMRFDWIL